jgi:NAD+ kinase
MILTPICPHTLSARPLIIGENDQVRITLELSEEEVMVTIDGQEGFTLEPKDEVIVKKSIYKTRLIAFKEKSFYAILREKLRWSGQVNK